MTFPSDYGVQSPFLVVHNNLYFYISVFEASITCC